MVLIVALLVGVQPPSELEVAAELACVGCGAHWGLPRMWIREVKSLTRGGHLLEAALRRLRRRLRCAWPEAPAESAGDHTICSLTLNGLAHRAV